MLVDGLKIRWNYNGLSTSCVIATMENQEIAQVTVKRFVRDTDNKRLARKISFVKVMRDVTQGNLLSKAQRTEIWNSFRENINQPIMKR